MNKVKVTPPGWQANHAGHHWVRNSIGRTIVLQWAPEAQKWAHSGLVGSDEYYSGEVVEYLGPVPFPVE